jgi:hypothetical protein
VHAQQAHVPQLGDEIAREDAALEPLPDLREHALAHELPHGVTDEPLLARQEPVDAEQVAGVEL